MSSSNYGNHADTVEIKFVKAKCNTEYDSFIIALDLAGVKFEDFCYFIFTGADDFGVFTEEEALAEAWDTLCKAFLYETGLELGCVHHSADEKSDELDGGSFSVEGVYELTSSGKKYARYIVRKFWTTYG